MHVLCGSGRYRLHLASGVPGDATSGVVGAEYEVDRKRATRGLTVRNFDWHWERGVTGQNAPQFRGLNGQQT